MQAHNYLPEELAQDDPDFKLREGLKPIDITQPEGVSFKFEGRTLVWQNWKVHVGFNYREGLVLSNITYDDGKNGTRPLFYRLSVAEMVVPVSIDCLADRSLPCLRVREYSTPKPLSLITESTPLILVRTVCLKPF